MIVLGSGRRGFDGWTPGSVSEHLTLHAPCSVEVIRGSVLAKGVNERSHVMKVFDMMMGTPYFCRPGSNLGEATELMWRGNCGFLPVVESDGKVVGVVTDRDICIALGTRGHPPGEVATAEVMSKEVYSCAPEDDVRIALGTMRDRHVRRLPVIAKKGKLVGVISMDDVLLRFEGPDAMKTAEEIVSAFRAINTHQLPAVMPTQTAA